jgi:hypothetical protein
MILGWVIFGWDFGDGIFVRMISGGWFRGNGKFV